MSTFPRRTWLAWAATATVDGLCRKRLVAQEATSPATSPSAPSRSRLDNGAITVGVDLKHGGAIDFLAPAGSDKNLVNVHDLGRWIQMSFYSGPKPYAEGDNRPAKHWEHLGWNPIQAGDDFDHGSQVVEHTNDGRTLYVRCIPLQWPLRKAPAECTFEMWLTLDGPAVLGRFKLKNHRRDKTWYPARHQELPAVYVNGPYHRLMTYTGPKPFADEPLSRIEKKTGEPGPWSYWQATEHWAALVDDQQFGLGVWHPGCSTFVGGFAGRPGHGGPNDAAAGYLSPLHTEHIDHDLEYEYHCRLIVGRLDSIRRYVYDHADRSSTPDFTFDRSRRHWHLAAGRDHGAALSGDWRISLHGASPQLISPTGCWPAETCHQLSLDAAFRTSAREARVYFRTHDAPHFKAEQSLAVPIIGDGQFRRYTFDLSTVPHYRGSIVGLRLDPVSGYAQGSSEDEVRIQRIASSASR